MPLQWTDMDDTALGIAVQNNLFALFNAMGNFPDSVCESTPHGMYHSVPGLLNPMFHGVSHSHLTEAEMPVAISATGAFFKERGVEFWFWWQSSFTTPSTLGTILESYGYFPFEVNAPAMAVKIADLPYTDSKSTHLTIAIVTTEQEVQEWCDTFQASFEVPVWAAQSWRDATLRYGIETVPWRFYLGKHGNTPVACSMLFCGAGVAGLIAVGTIPAVRGQGWGKAITIHPLLDAHTDGYQIGVLFSTEAGLPLYQRLGFRQYGTISRYLHR